jgi:hypothetical protein
MPSRRAPLPCFTSLLQIGRGGRRGSQPAAAELPSARGARPNTRPPCLEPPRRPLKLKNGFFASRPPFFPSGRFLSFPDGHLRSRMSFLLPARRSFFDGRFFGVPGGHLPSRALIFLPERASFFPERHPGFERARLSSWSVIFLPETPSWSLRRHPASGAAIPLSEALSGRRNGAPCRGHRIRLNAGLYVGMSLPSHEMCLR